MKIQWTKILNPICRGLRKTRTPETGPEKNPGSFFRYSSEDWRITEDHNTNRAGCTWTNHQALECSGVQTSRRLTSGCSGVWTCRRPDILKFRRPPSSKFPFLPLPLRSGAPRKDAEANEALKIIEFPKNYT